MQNAGGIDERQALETFLLDNPELEQLEALLGEFNLFEAIGAVRQELRHSDFLSFLLDPNQNHGLGDLVAKRFLQQALGNTKQDFPSQQETSRDRSHLSLTPLDIALLDLDDLEVRREWRHVDILLLDEGHRLAVIVENKVSSDEHSEQLQRYWQIVRRAYPNYRILGLYLTPDGRLPSDTRYLPVDYDLIHELVSDLVETRASVLGPDVHAVLTHYAQMLRRHIMPDSEIAELCRRIYRKHKRALDLIYEHRPDAQEELKELLVQWIEEVPNFILEHSSKTSIRFLPDSWDSPLLRAGSGWVKSGRMLLVEVGNRPDHLTIRVYVGPGPEGIRERLLDMAENNRPFNVYSRGTKWATIFLRRILDQAAYQEATVDEITMRAEKGWNRFRDHDLPRLTEVIREQAWLWPDDEETDTQRVER